MNSTSTLKQDLHDNHIIKSETNQSPSPEIPNSFQKIAETNLKLVAEGLQAYLTKTKTHTLEELNTISAIIHKYTTSYTQLNSVELKNRELVIKQQTANPNFKNLNSNTPPSPLSSSKSPSNSSKIAPPSPPSSQKNTSFPPNCSYGYTQDWAKPYSLPPKFYNQLKKNSAFF